MERDNRPRIVCHMMQTLDGRVASGVPGVEIFNEYFNTYVELEKNFPFKVYMCGRKTMEMFSDQINTPLESSKQDIDNSDFIVDSANGYYMVTVDNRGSLRWSKNFINLSGQIGNFHLVTIVTKSTPKDYLAYLKTKNISYIFAGEADVDFKQAMKTLTDKFGIKELLLEGGGLLNGSMMAADLVDEISLLTLPLVLNKSSAPSLFDHQDTPELDLKMYKLMETKQPTNDTIWLHYQKERDVK